MAQIQSITPQEPFPTLQWAWAIRDSELSPLVRLLAYEHFAHANAQGLCFPGVERLANALGLKARQTKNLRKELVVAGWLELVSRGTGRGNPSTYRLAFPGQKTGNRTGDKTGNESPVKRAIALPTKRDMKVDPASQGLTSIVGEVNGVEESAPNGAILHLDQNLATMDSETESDSNDESLPGDSSLHGKPTSHRVVEISPGQWGLVPSEPKRLPWK